MIEQCQTGKHPWEKIYEGGIDTVSSEVVRWCPVFGSIVVDVDYDGRTNPGVIKKITSPMISKYIAADGKERRDKRGDSWQWQRENVAMRSHWKNINPIHKGKNLVRIFPPSIYYDAWIVLVYDKGHYNIKGEDAEERAFIVGGCYARQNLTMAD